MNKKTLHSLFALLVSTSALACNPQKTSYDAESSRAFRAAWDKRRTGDEAGYKTAMAEVAKRRDTWAGERAALDLETCDEPASDSMLGHMLRQAAEFVGDPSRLGKLIPSAPAQQ